MSWHLSFIAEIFVHGKIPKHLWLPCLSTALSSRESTFPLFATTQPYLSSLSDTQVSFLYFLVRWVNLFLLPGVVWCYLCTADGWWSPHSGIGFHICSFCLLRELKTMHHICIFCRWWCRIYCECCLPQSPWWRLSVHFFSCIVSSAPVSMCGVIGFLAVNPSSAQVGLPGLIVLVYSSVIQ